MNVCDLRKGILEDLGKIVKIVLRSENGHGKQSSDERLYAKREDGGEEAKSFKETFDETKVWVVC